MLSSSPFIAETSFHVRYAETDAMGIVHHSSYIVYFEEGRSEYIRSRGSSYAVLERSGYALAVTEIEARYIKPARYDQLVTVRCWLGKLRSRSVAFEYEIVDTQTGEKLVTGRSDHVCLNDSGQVTRIPDEWLAWKET